MFNSDFPKALDDEIFGLWLENAREGKIKYNFLIITWDEFEKDFRPVYAMNREEVENYKPAVNESIVAVYDVYSEARITI